MRRTRRGIGHVGDDAGAVAVQRGEDEFSRGGRLERLQGHELLRSTAGPANSTQSGMIRKGDAHGRKPAPRADEPVAAHGATTVDSIRRPGITSCDVSALAHRARHAAVTTTVCPVIDVDVTNVSTCAAMSSAWPTRPSTACARAPLATASGKRFAIRVFSTSPGATQLTATSGAIATARQRVRWLRPALLDEYAMLLLPGLMPPADEMLTMWPPPSALSSRAAARASRKGARRFVSSTRSQRSGVSASRSGNGMPMFHAALLTRMSSRPRAFADAFDAGFDRLR